MLAGAWHPGLHDPDLKNQVSPPAAIYNQRQKSLTDPFQAMFHRREATLKNEVFEPLGPSRSTEMSAASFITYFTFTM